ncbi:MAG TPA: hypothetical protein VKZ18_25095 [Polyangia bacterium]|nr:hypothetical protein [Polyangia bacterium]
MVAAPGSFARYAPSFRLIKAHFGLGMVGLLAFSAALALRARDLDGFFFQPLLLGLVHLCVLGWLMPVALGAMHQLVPVVFETPVRSERLAWVAFALYAVSVPVFIIGMWTLALGWILPVAATGAATAIWLYVGNLVATLARAPRRSLTGLYVIAALGWLLLAVTLGVLLAWNLHRPYLPLFHIALLRAHAHAAGLGFFGLLIMGVAYRLLEMFLLSHGASERAGRLALVATNLALLALVPALAFQLGTPALALAVAAAAVGVASFIWQAVAIFRRRMRRSVDIAWGHTAGALVYLALAAAVGAGLALGSAREPWVDRFHLAYGLLALVGFAGSVVVGQLYKIVPFLVWLHRFAPYVGIKQVPAAADLLAERPKEVQFVLMHVGVIALVAGVVVDVAPLRVAGAAAFVASSLLFVRNLGVVLARQP